jgi:hypothetical protein
MLKDFFNLNSPFETFDSENFLAHLLTSKHICNVLYKPDGLVDQKIRNVVFENVSFSKTTIERVTFNDCTFNDCLFIGTEFSSVEFHDCKFFCCNFYKAKFSDVYAKPGQFRHAINDKKYSNIAVSLYQQLRENYYKESQREFKNEAEYFFGHWRRRNNLVQAKRKGKRWYEYFPSFAISSIYGYLLGYGYRLRNLIATTFLIIVATVVTNFYFAEYLFSSAIEPSVLKTLYFTITTMATLGASGYTPDTDIGYMFIVVNVCIGISIFSATISAIFKKVIR